ncbi:MAG: hypothetical protein K0U86_16090 [Planctomycetes bacterium]|nr:hypothetical protein [Planctomycetota bacterium]MCH9726421.1 hypothetical protein [Planctomycetota bacterium]MCH9778230.1 hypothetical protein [Planctomycetota bacterium]MCH9791968.1 hypothetical protein [Planctomycetota bacterium]MDF1745761.1 hypothetical protein [Gimesia sp.]
MSCLISRFKGPVLSIHRSTLLILGPLVLMTGFYLLTFSRVQEGKASSNAVQLRAPEMFNSPMRMKATEVNVRLQAECEAQAAVIKQRISLPINVLVIAPYVVMGDYETKTLEALYQKTILPVQHALSISYFDTQPDQPITIIALSSQKRYQQVAYDLDQRKTGSYYGYFQSDQMRIVLNLTTGSGTLGHELTHALAQIDFPAMPEWFDEGLASLHEQCEFSEEGNQLLGTDNWRSQLLLSALERQYLPELNALVQQTGIRKEQEALTYAHARYFCLYLQQKKLLSPFYRKLRTNQQFDQTGMRTLQQLLNVDDLSEVDADFHKWLSEFRRDTILQEGGR